MNEIGSFFGVEYMNKNNKCNPDDNALMRDTYNSFQLLSFCVIPSDSFGDRLNDPNERWKRVLFTLAISEIGGEVKSLN